MATPQPNRSIRQGLAGFTVVMVGQIISLLGSNMTGFALTIWAYQVTGQATALALVGFFYTAPMLILSPFIGALVDRGNRKLMMMVSDLVSGLITILILILYANGSLQIWHLYITSIFQGIAQGFQWPAYSAAITTMMPKEQYGRANGMLALAEAGSGIFAPLLAGALLPLITLVGIMLIDVVTFIFAIGALLFVHVPQPARTEEGARSQGSLWKEAGYGFRYILARPSLLGLQLVFLSANFFGGLAGTVMAPMILARTGNNGLIFGSVNSAGAIGGLIGGLVMSAWGGPRRKVHGVLSGWLLTGMAGLVLMGVGQAWVIWVAASFLGALLGPLINGSNQAIWQAKVAPDLQGRVFSIRRLIAWFVSPLAMLIAGPLADRVLEPGMAAGGGLTPVFSWLVGSGPGAGMALLMVFGGLGAALVGLGGYLSPAVYHAETRLPDHEGAAAAGD